MPAGRKKFLLILTLAAGPALAIEAELLRCSEMPYKEPRLSCFDALAACSVAAKQAGATPAVKAAAFAPRRSRAATSWSRSKARSTASSRAGKANSVLRLANGQTWQVIDGSSAIVHLKNPKVSVRRAAMGSFILELEGSNETARVRRRN